MSFSIYFVKGKEKNKSVLSNCRSCYMAHHPGLRAFPPALPHHLWQQEQAAVARLQNWGGKLACASRGFSFFVRRDISSLWGAGNRGGRSEGVQRVGTWLLSPRLGRMFSWHLPCPKKSQWKMVTLWNFDISWRREQTGCPHFFTTAFSFYSHTLRKYKTTCGEDIDFILDVVEFFFLL